MNKQLNKLEVEQHIIETTAKVKRQKELIAHLETQVLDVAAQGDVNKVVAAEKELAVARKLLDGLDLVLKSYQKKSKDLTEREPEAAKIRARLADELWPLALVEYEKLQRLQGELGPILAKVTALNDEMTTLRNQHKCLVGDSMYVLRVPIPQELYLAANAKLETLPKSPDIRLASERERDRLGDALKQQRPTISKILRHVKLEWPLCPTCGAELLATKYELAEDESKGYASLSCPQHPQQYMDINFPARAPPPGPRYPLPEAPEAKGPASLGDVAGSVPPIQSHGSAETPSLTSQTKGGKKAT
jgi:hypothetical protein